ncbi:VIT-domain-containing protein [Penicillium angulare]|uniref:VIT-domain-containing protein n=1 Tax=Penicillium angulare TaxID=116970 RepID=A0A9W9GD69_9EURO|nr:VIT-domain-containing protein [Penicillium angulare]
MPQNDPSSMGAKRESKYCLPILSVDIETSVEDTLACTELSQTFHNPSDMEITESKHTFPLYFGATVVAFECIIGDDVYLRGVVKPKEEAREIYRETVEKKKQTAALLEEFSPEIFESSLGNIPPHTDVQIKLTYLHELKVVLMAEDTTDGLAIIIPTSIAPRYGVQMPSASFEVKKLTITIRVLDNGTTSRKGWNIESPHADGVEYQGLQPMKEINFDLDSAQVLEERLPSRYKQSVWKYESQAILLKTDFIFTLPLQKKLYSSASISPPDSNGNVAMVVNLRPTDLFGSAVRPKSFTGEVLFVLDYSGSMGWTNLETVTSKVDTMRAAMSLALSGLPSTCSFNVVKFGSSAWGLWNESKKHTAEAVEDARNFTRARPDLGGTELVRALKAAVNRLDTTKSSAQIIVITDGELDPIPVAEYIWLIRKKLQNKVRFFALGIGDNVSHQLIECIAEFGGGLGDVVNLAKRPRWEDRLNRLLRAALEPDSWHCEISLGHGFERQSLQCIAWGADENRYSSLLQDQTPNQYIQAPYPTPHLHPFSYKSVYFLLKPHAGNLSKKVTVTTATSGARTKSHSIPVNMLDSSLRFLPYLAAKACLLSLENEIRQISINSELARSNAEYLGQSYFAISPWTSFVTVSQNSDKERDENHGTHFEQEMYRTIPRSINIQDTLSLYEQGYERPLFTLGIDGMDSETSGSGKTSTPPMFSSSFLSGCNNSSGHQLGFDSIISESFAFGGFEFSHYDTEAHDSPSPHSGSPHSGSPHSGSPDSAGPSSVSPTLDRCASESSEPNQFPPPMRAKERSRSFPRPAEMSQSSSSSSLQKVDSSPKRSEPPGVPEIHEEPSSSDDYVFDGLEETYDIGQVGGWTSSTTAGKRSMSHSRFDQACEKNSDPCDPVIVETGSKASTLHPRDVINNSSTEGINMSNENIAWEEAITDQMPNGTFRLLVTVRKRLLQHYCLSAPSKIREMLIGFPSAHGLSMDILHDCEDTFMMIQYFRTHMAHEEDTWCLMMSRAESALLTTFGLSDDEEEQLEPFFEMLQLSTMHQHLLGFQHSRGMDGVETRVDDSGSSLKCPACDKVFGVVVGISRFFCPFEDDDDDENNLGTSLEWDNWIEYWHHQVESGHVVCPTI